MMKWIWSMVMVCALCACHSQSENAGTPNVKDSANQIADAEAVQQRVQEIYSDVFKEYNLEDSLRNLDKLDGPGASARRGEFIQNYCSQEWNDLSRQIREIDSLYHAGEMGFWEADYWIMGQDWHQLSISDVEVQNVTPTEAHVKFMLHNLGEAKPVALILVKEDGIWKIDNFNDLNIDMDWKRAMKEYVGQESAKNKK
ncbi:MAG: DUF3828 domain-containing protein [Muribaculaceae bacterium]|nr:DUF3828 domain-containing protein [Muribaculaceae bacterium]